MAGKKKSKDGLKAEVELPEGVLASIDGNIIKVSGEHGEITKKIQSNVVDVKIDGGKIILSVKKDRKKDRSLLHTERGNVWNMINGVKEPVEYKMKVVYSHFPMNTKVEGNTLVIDNFLGEKHPRKATLLEGVTVDIKGQDITLTGIDKDTVGQTAANIEQTTKIKNLDPRVFQDGIYITEKHGKPIK